MKARFRLPSGGKIELNVLDVSPIGCMVDRRGWSARADDRVLVQFDGLGFLPASVMWVEDDLAGVEFEQLLHETVLLQLQQGLAEAA